MNITKDKLRDAILSVRSINGMITLYHVPMKTIYSAESVYNLYYSGRNKIEIGSYFSTGREYKDVTDSNFDEIIDKIYDLLSDDVGDYIMKALDDMELEDTYLKYFDDEPELFKTFQETVLKLKCGN